MPQASEAADIPILIDGLGELFGGLTSVIRVPGPENTLLAQGGGYLVADVCKNRHRRLRRDLALH